MWSRVTSRGSGSSGHPTIAQRALVLLFLAVVRMSPLQAQACTAPDPESREWIRDALVSWIVVTDSILEVRRVAWPRMIFLGPECAWWHDDASAAWRRLNGTRLPSFDSLFHGSAIVAGQVRLPDGSMAAVEPVARAGLSPDKVPFFVMALPVVFAKALPPNDTVGLSLRLLSAASHEMMHTVQLGDLQAALLQRVQGRELPKALDDDLIERTFEGNATVAASVRAEAALLYEAASVASTIHAASLADSAIRLIRDRRARHFTREYADYSIFEDLFLNMEGLGEFVRLRYHETVRMPPGVVGRPALLTWMRGSSNTWSQELGLGLVLVIERLQPGCVPYLLQTSMPSPLTVLDHLRKAPDSTRCANR